MQLTCPAALVTEYVKVSVPVKLFGGVYGPGGVSRDGPALGAGRLKGDRPSVGDIVGQNPVRRVHGQSRVLVRRISVILAQRSHDNSITL